MKRTLLVLLMAVGFAGGLFSQITNPYFEKVPYRGAFGTYDWTSGWANWTPQNTNYPPVTTTISGEITANTSWGASSSPVIGKASFTATNLQNSFFEQVNYIGAFGSVNWTSPWANWTPQTTVYPAATVTVTGDITTNTNWTNNNVYLLNGFVYVKSGATLTIQAGTVIRGDKTSKGTLIIEKGGKINAVGTANSPIVFTSNQAAGSRDYGDWGGVVICGNATINVPGGVATVEGGPTSTYGGGANPNDQDSSGVMKYIRIEFSGIPLEPNKEINGLTMGGVGNKTVLDYIQVSYCGDDAFEWFGGTVNAKHLISFRNWDDDFDTDYGFKGKIQFAVALRDPAIADVSASNGFESDNDGQGSTNTPITNCIFSNISVFGPKVTSSTTIHSDYKRSMHLRRNTKLCVYNSVFTGYPVGLFIDGTAAQTNATNNELQVQNCLLAGMVNFFASNFERTYFMNPTRHNDTLVNNNQLMLVDPFNLSAPNFLPSASQSVYLLQGFVYVRSGATLTIEPGTIIRGDKTSKGTLIVEKGAKINAVGTVNNPIVFTSNVAPGLRDYGDWGGVVLCGKATINVPGGSATVEGGPTSTYGGNDDADNSGKMKYVRIEFPGIPLEPNKEINGLTLGGVGSGTELEYIQVSYSGDDAFEWFGGTVNAKHLIAFRTWDDDFDTDYGFRGMVQFGVSLRDPNIADVSGSNSFESDNDGQGSSNTPITKPIFSNISSFGPKVTASTTIHSDYKRAMHLRRNTATNVYNSVFAGWPTGLFLDGSATQSNATNGILKIQNTSMAGMTSTFFASAFERAFFKDSLFENDTLAANVDLLINDPFNLNNPNFLPMGTSPLLNTSIWASVESIVSNNSLGLVVYPNPATSVVNVELNLESDSKTVVELFDMTGRKVSTLVNEKLSGFNSFSFDLSDVTKGMYLLKVQTANATATSRIVLK